MKITEVRVKLTGSKKSRLKAFCSVTIDNEFVVREIKIIQGSGGDVFATMPSRRMSDHCDKCGCRNHLQAKFCNNCGAALAENRAKKDYKGRTKLYVDIAHPLSNACRTRFQETVLAAYKQEVEKSKQPDYKPVQMDGPDGDIPDVV